ncbi:MAG: hypothetical protein L0I76_38220 [Pseudonocardia sp.]|nr:hypothetical protein [Pseudonocardia sp.]
MRIERGQSLGRLTVGEQRADLVRLVAHALSRRAVDPASTVRTIAPSAGADFAPSSPASAGGGPSMIGGPSGFAGVVPR